MKSAIALGKRSPDTIQFLEEIQRTVHAIASEADIILYGSQARGDASPVSDWDFLILVDQPIDQNLVVRIRDRLYDLELETDNIVSSIIRTRQEWNSPKYSVLPFKMQVEQEGIVL